MCDTFLIYSPLHLKGVCHKIFDLQYFSWFEPNWAPDKQAKLFSNSVSISSRYLITKLSPRCAEINKFFEQIKFFFFKSFLSWQMCSPLKGFLLIVHLKATKESKIFNSDSAVWCTLLSLTPRYDAHRRAWLHGGMHTAELDSAV